MTNQRIDSPVGNLEWVFIDGEGKADLQGNMKYSVNLVLTEEDGEQFKAVVNQFWEDNKPKGAKAAKSLGLYPHKTKDEAASKEAGENIYAETGKLIVTFKTGTTYQSGDQKIIKIFNSKGNEVSLMGKKIGNGSRGRVSGIMAIYNINKATSGVTFYLDAIQLSKFVEFTGGTDFGAIDDDGEGFEGVPGEMPGAIEDEQQDRPRL